MLKQFFPAILLTLFLGTFTTSCDIDKKTSGIDKRCSDVTCDNSEACNPETGFCESTTTEDEQEHDNDTVKNEKAITDSDIAFSDKCKDVYCGANGFCHDRTGECQCDEGYSFSTETSECEEDTCAAKLDDSSNDLMKPVDSYGAYLILKIVGTIYDDNDSSSKPPLLSEGTYKDYNGIEHNIAEGGGKTLASEQDGTPMTILLGFSAVEKVPDFGDISYKVVQNAIPTANLVKMKEEEICILEGAGGGIPFVFEVFFDTPDDSTMNLRKQCIIGAGEVVDNTLTGRLFVESAKNIDFAAGEHFNGILNLKMFGTEEEVTTFLNTNEDGTIAEPGDADYQHLCTCFAEDGETEEDCPEHESPID